MSATLDILAPADQTEGTRSQVLRWLKTVGDSVSEHEPLIEIETDKVTVEVAAPASGVLCEIVKAEAEEIEPGEVLGRLERLSAAADPGAAVHRANANGVASVGSGAPAVSAPAASTAATRHRVSPAVQRLLDERGLDATTIIGTGDQGRITIDDVLNHAASSSTATGVSTPPITRNSERTRAAALKPSRVIPHTAIRKRIADHMVASLLQTAPHVTTVFEADLTAILAHRAMHREHFDAKGAPLTLTAYFLSATVAAIKAVPEANSHWADSTLEIFDTINLGVATAIEGTGLVVPVLKNVETLELFDIAKGLNELVTKARNGTLEPSDVRAGTFTISNHGVSGSLLATPIVINQPQSAILGIGKLEKRAVVMEDDGEHRIVVRPKCYVTLTIDHRVMDGHQANRFLQTFVRTLESWPAT